MTSGIRTEWHLAALSGSADPFATTMYSTGAEIDLQAGEDELFGRLQRLLHREARLFDTGLTCELKDAGQDCRSCPMATLEASEPRARLCRLGKDQFLVAGRVQELTAQRLSPLGEVAALADEFSEVGHLDAELIELLTAVGL